MNIEIIDGKAYLEVIDPLMNSTSLKTLDIEELYKMMKEQLDARENDVLFYRGVARQWEDKYNELTKGLNYAEKLLKAAK